MTPSRLIISIITVLWIKGVDLSKEKQVFQTPAELLMKPNAEVSLNLRHEIPSYDTILWYQRSARNNSLTLIGYVFYKIPTIESTFSGRFSISGDGEKSASLHIKNLTSEDSCEYFGAARIHIHCDSGYEAHFGQGTKLTVLEPGQAVKSPKVKVFRPSSKECRNPIDNEREKTLVCVASDFYPDHVSVYWQIIQLNVTSGVNVIRGENVTRGVTTDEAALRKDKVYTITSRLKVSAEDWYKPEWNFECIVRFFNGTHDTDYKDSISGEQGPDILTREKYLRITRQAKLSYSVLIIKSSVYGAFVAFLVWRLQSSAEKQNH
ncbi:M1-specific T cell receptor beta chain isoform X2 [Paralichthys olivaceus]|uniref:M1-specific T cell receptor beta chain isoform X2 n=1 Tax=Paralichthys olivaceus TaxID=8255 RepID=UPI00374FFCF2